MSIFLIIFVPSVLGRFVRNKIEKGKSKRRQKKRENYFSKNCVKTLSSIKLLTRYILVDNTST